MSRRPSARSGARPEAERPAARRRRGPERAAGRGTRGLGSIRRFLLTRLSVGAGLVLAGAALAVYLTVTRTLEAQFDANSEDRVRGFASILFQTAETLSFEFSDELMPEYDAAELPAYFQLRFADGREIEASESLAGGELAMTEPPGPEPRHWDAPLPDGRPGRYVAQEIEVHHVYPEEGPDRPRAARVQVVIARGREPLERAERRLLLACMLGAGTVLLLLVALAWFAVGRGLAPTRRLAAELDAIRVDDLPASFGLPGMPRELRPVERTIDTLIRRLDSALRRERRTTADIAHELRTPISELVTVSEVALRAPDDGEGAQRALATTRDVSSRMGRAVSTLLELARLEMGTKVFAEEDVDLGALVREALRPLAGLARERGLEVECAVAAGELVPCDRDVLRIVVSNLLGNAHAYATAGGRVACRLERGDGRWRFCVENVAHDLEAADLPRLSEPFWRKDGARGDRERTGLGLALSRALAVRAGLALEFELEAGTFRALLAGPVSGEGRELGPRGVRAPSGRRTAGVGDRPTGS